MKNVCKLLTLVFVLCFSVLMAGCGGDKFAGQWYYIAENGTNLPSYEVMTLTKDGNGYRVGVYDTAYVLKKEIILNKADVDAEREAHRTYDLSPSSVEYKYKVIPNFEITLKKKVQNNTNAMKLEEKEGKLYNPLMPGRPVAYYDEKENCLNFQGLLGMIKLKKVEDGKLETVDKIVRERIEKSVKDYYGNNKFRFNSTYKRANVNKVIFEN